MIPKCPYCNRELEIFNIRDPVQDLVVFKLRCRPCNFETNQGFTIKDVMDDEKGELLNDTMQRLSETNKQIEGGLCFFDEDRLRKGR